MRRKCIAGAGRGNRAIPGTDHGSGGGAFLFGKNVKGGLYSDYPSLNPRDWEHGEDLKHTIDFRSVYSTVLEKWMGIDSRSIVKGDFEQLSPFVV